MTYEQTKQVVDELLTELNRDDVIVRVVRLTELGCTAVSVHCQTQGIHDEIYVHQDDFLVDGHPHYTDAWVRERILLIIFNLTER